MSTDDPRSAPAAKGQGRSAADPWAAFRCSDARECLKLLRELRDLGPTVTLCGPDGVLLAATLWTVDTDRQRVSLDVEPLEPRLDALVEANELTAIAYLGPVKLQFDLQDLVLVRADRRCALQARLPVTLYRFQRRAAYRVRASSPQAHALLRHPALPDMRLQLRLLDLSPGGCALQLPADVPPLPLGALVHGVTLVLDGETRIEGALRLAHITSTGNAGTALRLGCSLTGLSPEAQGQLQRYIDRSQRRLRTISLE